MDTPVCQGCLALERQVADLQRQVARLTELLEQTRRSGKRQAAPFAKGKPKDSPKKPGRKPGDDYGKKGHRPPPPADQIDETHDAPLPDVCPDCGGPIHETQIDHQYQTEIPREPLHRQFDIHVGRCHRCDKTFRGRHPLQTSDAVGAAASQLGPDAQAAVVELNKSAGLSHGKVIRVFRQLFGIRLTRGGSAHTILRAGRRCQPVYAEIQATVKAAPRVVPDETGWRIGGRPAWLHVLAAPTATLYGIIGQRDHTFAERVLGLDYAGQMTHDGWKVYERFHAAIHQACHGHLLRRCHELLETATRGAVYFPRQIQTLLRLALTARDRHAANLLTTADLGAVADLLENRLFHLTWAIRTDAANERLAKFLRQRLDSVFACLRHPGLDATNWRAEQALRPAVVNRKVWGGNRTEVGAEAQSILMSVWRTLEQRGQTALDWLSLRLRNARTPLPLPP